MIRRITGTIIDVRTTYIVIDVGGIGYLVYTPQSSSAKLDTTITLHTYLAVRETALDLYGFVTRDALNLFELLLSLPKIGPKSALQILTQADMELIQSAVIADDPAQLSKMSGIGKKTAEKIVMGLKDAFDADAEALAAQAGARTASQGHSSDTIDALVALGYPQADARKVVQQLLNEKPEITNANDAVREALRILGSS